MIRNIPIGTRLNKIEHQQFNEAIQSSNYKTMSDFIRIQILNLIGTTTSPIKEIKVIKPKKTVSISIPVELDSLVRTKSNNLGLNYSETISVLLNELVVSNDNTKC